MTDDIELDDAVPADELPDEDAPEEDEFPPSPKNDPVPDEEA